MDLLWRRRVIRRLRDQFSDPRRWEREAVVESTANLLQYLTQFHPVDRPPRTMDEAVDLVRREYGRRPEDAAVLDVTLQEAIRRAESRRDERWEPMPFPYEPWRETRYVDAETA